MIRILALFVFLAGCGGEEPKVEAPAPVPPPAPAPAAVDPAKLAGFAALPARMDLADAAPSADLIALGRVLYYDPRFSKNQDISCNSCHQLDKFGVDNNATSPGHKGQLGGRNSPTTYNAAGHVAQFWDGRAATIEDQAKGPVLNPVEMAMPGEAQVVALIESIPDYKPMFEKAFPGDPKPISYDNLAKAIGAFERGLVTPDRFDKLLGGDQAALTDAEKKGLDTFVSSGCTACHTGTYIGGASYQKLGMVNPWPDTTSDEGRFAATKADADKMFFKVPSLRNITKTGPYFHDGKVASLDEAVKLMGHHQLGKELTPEEVTSIVTFLGALEGTPDAAYVAKPELPASGPKTPKPDPS
jgi:cytochrome c peroxidase